MDKIEKLYQLYIDNNIITADVVSLEMFRQSNDVQQSGLLKLGKERKLFSQDFEETNFKKFWGNTIPQEQQVIEAPEVVENNSFSGNSDIQASSGAFPKVDKEAMNSDLIKEETSETVTEGVEYDAREDESSMFKENIIIDKNATPLERSLAFVNDDLFKRDEGPVVELLDYHFPFEEYGFKFEESGILDNVTVTAPDGVTKETFGIDSGGKLFSSFQNNSEESRKLRDFIRNNADQEKRDEEITKKYFSVEAMNFDIDVFTKQNKQLTKNATDYFERKKINEAELTRMRNSPGTFTQQEYDLQIMEKNFLRNQENVLKDQYEQFQETAGQLDLTTGNYVLMKEKQGDVVTTAIGGAYNQFLKGTSGVISTGIGSGLDIYYEAAQAAYGNDYGYTEEEYRDEFIRVYEGYKGLEVPESAKESKEGFEKWTATLKDSDVDRVKASATTASKRDGVRINYDAEGQVIGESTHKMRAETDGNGNWFAFPTLFQNEDGSWDDTYEKQIEKSERNWKGAYEEAKKRGELVSFGSDEEAALAYADGSWKENYGAKQTATLDSAQPTGDLEGNMFTGQYKVVKNDPRLQNLNFDQYDIAKGVKIPFESTSMIGQPLLQWNSPEVWSKEEDDWVKAPGSFGESNVFDQVDALVGDQKIKGKKNAVKEISRNLLVETIGADNVSNQRIEAQMNQGSVENATNWDVTKGVIATGYYGAFESVPALLPMIYGAIKNKKLVKPKGPAGKSLKAIKGRLIQSLKNYATDGYRQTSLLAMAALHADKLNQRMENNPEFEWVTENEKKAVVLPLATASAILETLGFRMLLKGTSGTKILTGITTAALNQLPKGATPAMFRRAVVNIMDNQFTRRVGKTGVAKFINRATPGMLAEAETGALQEMSDIGGTEYFNSIKGKDLFKNPEIWSNEYWTQVAKAAGAEAVGGFVLGSPSSITAAFTSNQKNTEVNEEMITLFDKIFVNKNNSQDDAATAIKAYEASVQQKMDEGLISRSQGADMLNDFRTLQAAATDANIATDLNEKQKAKAIELFFQKRQLEVKMSQTNKNLPEYQEQQEMLEQIEYSISLLGKNQADQQSQREIEEQGIETYVEVTEEEVMEALKQDGIEAPTEQQKIDKSDELKKTKQNGLQEQSTEGVVQEESAEGGGEVGQTVPSNEQSTNESTEETETNIEETAEEEVSPEEKIDYKQQEVEERKNLSALQQKGRDLKILGKKLSKIYGNLITGKTQGDLQDKYEAASVLKENDKKISENEKAIDNSKRNIQKIKAEAKEKAKADKKAKRKKIEVKPEKGLSVTKKIEQRLKTISNLIGQKKILNRLKIFEKSPLPENYFNLGKTEVELVDGTTVKVKDIMDMSFKEFTNFVDGLNKSKPKVEENYEKSLKGLSLKALKGLKNSIISTINEGEKEVRELGKKFLPNYKGKLTKQDNDNYTAASNKIFNLKNKLDLINKAISKIESEPKAETKAEPKVEPKAEPKVEPKVEEEVAEDEEVDQQTKDDLDEFFEGQSTEQTKSEPSISLNRSKGELRLSKTDPVKIIKAVKKAAKAMIKTFPSVKFVLHDSTELFSKATKGRRGRGYFDPTTKTIHINMETASVISVGHEVTHAIANHLISTDAKAEVVFDKVLSSLQRILKGTNPELLEKVEKFSKRYSDKTLRSEEAASELMGILSENWSKLSRPKKNKIIDLLDRFFKKLRIPSPFKNNLNKTDEAVLEFFNTVSKKIREGESIAIEDVSILSELATEVEAEGTNPIGNPTEINPPRAGRESKIDFKDSYDMSLVTPKNKINLSSLIENIISNDQKVWFWVADQLGLGDGMDAGPSFALQPENIKKKAIWASGLDNKKLERNISAADFIFIISGSPETSKLFNKKVFDKYTDILGDYNSFKKKALETNPVKAIRETLQEFDSWAAMRKSPKRKTFLIAVNVQSTKPNTKFHKLVNTLGGFVDLQSLRDGFYRENNFVQNDIMLVLKPTGIGEKSNHSTYSTDILGEVVGVPDIKLNAEEIMPQEIKDKIKGKNVAEKTSSIAPYGGAVGTAVKNITKPSRKGREQLPTLQEVESRITNRARFMKVVEDYGMKKEGYMSYKSDLGPLQRAVREYGFRIETRYITEGKRRGTPTGYFLTTGRNAEGFPVMYNPKLRELKTLEDQKPKRKGREQMLDKESEAIKIVMLGREEGGFTDSEIKYYLKKRGFNAKDIKIALAIDPELFPSFPKSFGNVIGGFKNGVKLLAKINKFHKKVIEDNNNKKKYKQESLNKLVNKTIEYMYTTPEYKALGVKGSRMTSKQQALEVDLLDYLSPGIKTFNGARVRALNKQIRNTKFSEKNLKRIQRSLRLYIRTVMPRNLLGKAAYIKLIDKINAVDETNYDAVVAEITDIATELANKNLNKSILDILNETFTEIQSGRLKGVKVSQEVKDRIYKIAQNTIGYVPGKKGSQGKIPNKDTAKNWDITNEDMVAHSEMLRQKIRSLETETVIINGEKVLVNKNFTTKEAREISDLAVALQYSEALVSFANNDPLQTNALEQVLFNLQQLQEFGISGLQLQLLRNATAYMNNAINILQDMGVIINPLKELEAEGKENITQDDVLKKFKELKEKIRIDAERGRVKKVGVRKRLSLQVSQIAKYVNTKLGTAEDLTGLMDRISLSTGDLFGGITQEIVTKEVRKASRIFKGRMLKHELEFGIKMTELFGKKWLKKNRQNNRQTDQIIISEAKQIVLENERDRILKDKKMSSGEQQVLIQAIDKEINSNVKMISQNELLYFRNQGLDPSLEASFEATFKPTPLTGDLAYLNKEFDNKNEYTSRIQEEITKKIDPKLIELGDWMVRDFYPKQYEHYNNTYKEIYRTDMPWNQNYAGRLYRASETDIVGLDLLDMQGNQTWISNANAASTKSRQESNSAIMQTNAVDALLNYTRDMEYFAAYAIPVRNINKMFSDKAVKSVISEKFGKDINRYINDQITKIANKGAKHQKDAGLINFFNNTFLLSRLGLNPTLVLKQMTSFVTYGNDIGYNNWLAQAGKTGWSGISSDMREIMDNSVVLQDRYGAPITRVLETYQDEGFKKLDGQNDAINKYFNKENQNTLVKALMAFTMAGDKGAIMLGGMPNYRYYKEQFKKQNPNATNQEAIDYAIVKFEADTLRTQQSYDLQDKDYWQTSNAFARAFNMFLTTPKQYLRREIIAARNFSRIVRSGGKQGKGTVWQNARTLFVYHSIMPMFFQYVSMGLPGLFRDRRDEDLQELGIAALLGNINALFIIGDLVEMSVDQATGKPWGSQAPSIPVFEQAARLNVLKDRADKTKNPIKKAEYEMKYYLELSTMVGIPAPQLVRMGKNFTELATGDVDGFGDALMKAFNFSEFAQEGRKVREAKPKPATMTMAEMKKYLPEEYAEIMREKEEYEYENADEIEELELEKDEARREYDEAMREMYLDN